MTSTLTYLNITALAAANLNFTPSTLARRGSETSLSSSLAPSEDDFTSHHHHLFHSLHLHSHSLLEHWREHVWTYTPHRHEEIALGHVVTGRRVLAWEEMKEEIGRLPGLGRLGWAGVVPVAGIVSISGEDIGAWAGWRVKGATW